jgi:serine/threonine protein kinase
MSETERFEIVRSLGRDSGTFVARDKEARGRLVVLERVKRATLSEESAAELLRRTRILAATPHPCLERVREPIETEDAILVVSDFVDGEWLAALKDARPRPTLEVLLRILLDAMRGLAALLESEDKSQLLVHGGLSPEAILVTPQGTTIVSRFARGVRRLADVRSDAAYIPFEVLRGRRKADERTDVYSVGAMLWESLTGERPLAGLSLTEIIETATETRVPPARVPASAPWAEPLAEVAWRALALDPEERQQDVIAVAAEVRRIAGARVADPVAVEDFMKNVGAVVRVRERRASLERGDEEAPVSSSQLLSDSDIQVVPVPPLPQRPKTSPPPLKAVSTPPHDRTERAQPNDSSSAIPAAIEKWPARLSKPDLEGPEPGDRASLDEVMATPPKLPTESRPDVTSEASSSSPTAVTPIEGVDGDSSSSELRAAHDSTADAPKVIVDLPTPEVSEADASEAEDTEREREAWQRKQPTLRPPPRSRREAPPARSSNRAWTLVMVAAAMGLGWWMGRRSAESDSAITTTAHAGDLQSSASCTCPPPATTLAENATPANEAPRPTASTPPLAASAPPAPSTTKPVATLAAIGTAATPRPLPSAAPKPAVTVSAAVAPKPTSPPQETAKPEPSPAPKPTAFDPNEP